MVVYLIYAALTVWGVAISYRWFVWMIRFDQDASGEQLLLTFFWWVAIFFCYLKVI